MYSTSRQRKRWPMETKLWHGTKGFLPLSIHPVANLPFINIRTLLCALLVTLNRLQSSTILRETGLLPQLPQHSHSHPHPHPIMFFDFFCSCRTTDEPEAEAVPLDTVPSTLAAEHDIQLAPYYMPLSTCTNVAALVHNAVRAEIADMYCEVLPALDSLESVDGISFKALSSWWRGFARLALTTSLADDHLVSVALNDIVPDYDADSLAICKSAAIVRERNTALLEPAVRGMARSLESLRAAPSEQKHQVQLGDAWQKLATTLTTTYRLVEQLCADVDDWRRADIAVHPRLEREVADLYCRRSAWGTQARVEMAVLLTRWFGNEPLMREWYARNLRKVDKGNVDKWLEAYHTGRLQLVEHFHHKSCMSVSS